MAREHNPTLDGVRGLAILGVLLTHAAFWFKDEGWSRPIVRLMALGGNGVDLFFVLSGFLITGILLDTRAAGNRTRSFYARRILRIFPLYYGCLTIACIVAVVYPSLHSLMVLHSWMGRFAFFLYLQNWYMLAGASLFATSVVGHFWTLAVEEQFYIVWPWIVWLLPFKYLLKVCIAGSALALILRIALVAHFGPVFWIRNITPTRADALLIGGALAALLFKGERIGLMFVLLMAATGCLAIIFVALHDYHEIRNDNGVLMSTIGYSGMSLLCCSLVASCVCRIPVLTSAFNLKWLRELGRISYGVYVYHVPVNYALRAALIHFGIRDPLPLRSAAMITICQIVTACVIARLSYLFLESKFLAMKRYSSLTWKRRWYFFDAAQYLKRGVRCC